MDTYKKNKIELNKQVIIMKQITEIENMLIKRLLQNKKICKNIINNKLEAINYYKKIITLRNLQK